MPSGKYRNLKGENPIARSGQAGGGTSPTRVIHEQMGEETEGLATSLARKQPRQSRSRQMVAAIMQAAAETFAELGYARTTTNKIAERAGVSIGSLYQYFPNKDSVLLALHEEHLAEIHPKIASALERLADQAIPFQVAFGQMLTDLEDLHQVNPALTQALSLAVVQQSPALKSFATLDHKQFLQQTVAILAERPDVRQGDHLAMGLILLQTIPHLSHWLTHDAPSGVTKERLVKEVVQLISRYLVKNADDIIVT